MKVQLNTTTPVTTPVTTSLQSPALPTASTISSQADKGSKSILDHIINFFKMICCCCSSKPQVGNEIARPQEGNEIARLIEEGKSKEAAEAWVALIEQDARVVENPERRFQKWFDASASADSYTSSGDFGKKFFGVDDSPAWAQQHQAAFIQFMEALPEAVGQSSNPAIAALKERLVLWLDQGKRA